MADFPTSKSLNLTMTGSVQTLGVTYKENFFILNSPASTGSISILAGDNNVVIWVLAPGDSFQVSSLTVTLSPAIDDAIPLKALGTADDVLVGFLAS